jgi:hypothetical protein
LGFLPLHKILPCNRGSLLLTVYRYEKTIEEVAAAPRPIVFLAGPTVRGNQPHLTSWRFAAIKEFEKQNFSGSLVIPEFTNKLESDKGKSWIVFWENNGLTLSDCTMFWIPRTRELIGLTTNFEIGYWLARAPDKLVYGRPDDAFRMEYVDGMWYQHFVGILKENVVIYKTLEATITATIDKIIHRKVLS